MNRRAILCLLAAAPLLARPAAAEAHRVFVDAGVAIRGIDPVCYFTDGMPVAGSDTHVLMWKGAVWQFASADNREMFEMNPAQFAPRYGGYCAYAMAQGYLASTVPDAWTIHDNRLYLNYSVNVRGLWLRDVPGNIAKADTNWPDILQG